MLYFLGQLFNFFDPDSFLALQAQITCCTSTKVQILTPEERQLFNFFDPDSFLALQALLLAGSHYLNEQVSAVVN
jgi:hypothetical protein